MEMTTLIDSLFVCERAAAMLVVAWVGRLVDGHSRRRLPLQLSGLFAARSFFSLSHPPTTTSTTTIVQHCFAFMSWSRMGKAVILQPEGGAGAGGVGVGVDG